MNRVIHFEFQANNIERAQAFYEKALGWKFTHAMTKEKGGMDYWTIDTGSDGPGINGGMYLRSSVPDKNYLFDCTVGVEDIDKAIKDVKAAGGTIVRAKGEIPGVGQFATVKDTEGNKFGMLQPVGMKNK